MQILSQLSAVLLCECVPHPSGKISLICPGQQFPLLWGFLWLFRGRFLRCLRSCAPSSRRAVLLQCCSGVSPGPWPRSEPAAVRGHGSFSCPASGGEERSQSRPCSCTLCSGLLGAPNHSSVSCVSCPVRVLRAGYPSPQRKLSNCFIDPLGSTCFPNMLLIFLFSCWQHLQIGKHLALSVN